MTGPSMHIPHRRASDNGGWLGRVRSWWTEWGQLIMGVWLLAVSFVVIWVAVNFWQSQRDTALAAKASCERAMLLGPYLAADYERRHVFPAKVVPLIRSTLPKSCPD